MDIRDRMLNDVAKEIEKIILNHGEVVPFENGDEFRIDTEVLEDLCYRLAARELPNININELN